MTSHAINVITRWVVLGPFVLWAIWELALICMRGPLGMDVRLISQEARSLAARGLPSLAYTMTGLAVHFFVTWRRVPWGDTTETVLGVIWWALLAAYLLADWLDPDRAHWPLLTQYLRHPTTAALVGGVGAWVFFPQKSIWTPGAS